MKILYLLMTILKFLGISILILFILFLFLFIIILTVPIKYNIYVKKREKIYAYTKIKWLSSIVSIDIVYDSDNEMEMIFKLFGIVIKPKKRKTKVKKPRQAINEKETNKSQEDMKEVYNKKTLKKMKERPQKSVRKRNKKATSKNKIKNIITQIQSFTYKKELLVDTIKWIRRVFKALSPNNLLVDIEIGREDPAETGWLMAIIWILYPYYYPSVNIVANYDKECFYGEVSTNGTIVLGRLIYDFLKYIRTQSVKELIVTIRRNRKGKVHGRKTGK